MFFAFFFSLLRSTGHTEYLINHSLFLPDRSKTEFSRENVIKMTLGLKFNFPLI